MSTHQLVARHVEAALNEAAASKIDEDVVARCLLSEAIRLFKHGRSNGDIKGEFDPVFQDDPHHSQRRPSQRIGILAARRLLVDGPEADQDVELVGQCHRNAHRIRRHAIRWALRFPVIFACSGDRAVFTLCQRIIFAHQALQLGKFADHFGEQVGLRQQRCSFCLCLLYTSPSPRDS